MLTSLFPRSSHQCKLLWNKAGISPKCLLYCGRAAIEKHCAEVIFQNYKAEPSLQRKSCFNHYLVPVNNFPDYFLYILIFQTTSYSRLIFQHHSKCFLKYRIFFTSLYIKSKSSLLQVKPIDALSCMLNVYMCWDLGKRGWRWQTVQCLLLYSHA